MLPLVPLDEDYLRYGNYYRDYLRYGNYYRDYLYLYYLKYRSLRDPILYDI